MSTLTKSPKVPLTGLQKKILLALASTVGLRMLGLFLVLPVFTLYGLQFTKSRFLVGFAFGSYGLTMAILQIPFGRLSDRIGRRKVLILGMALFSLGSLLCATPHLFPAPSRIWVLIAGRLVQGGGAIISTAFAAVADHIPEDRRSTAMAVLGIPIGAAFAVGIIGGPFLAGIFGTASLFWLTGGLGIVSDLLLAGYLPEVPPKSAVPHPLREVVVIRPILSYSLGGFLMNSFMTAFFFFFPLVVTNKLHLEMTDYYRILIPMMLVSGLTMFAFSRGADHGYGKPLSALAFVFFIPSFLALFRPSALGFATVSLHTVLLAGTLFYVGFTGLEPILPNLVSQAAPETAYGTALGVYNTSQFLGSWVGASLAGVLSRLPADKTLYTLLAGAVAGFLVMLATRKPASTGILRRMRS
jgi:MFS family permease